MKFIDFLDNEKPEWVFGSVCFLVMEHCGGGSLADWIRKMREAGRRTKIDEAAIIGAQMISALSYCHRLNKVHLDLKPENILISGEESA